MTPHLDEKKLTQLLTQGTRQLNETTLDSLANARRKALERHSSRAPVFVLATDRWTFGLLPHSALSWAFIALLVAMFALATNYWHDSEVKHISALDVAILTDELPIEVFVD